MFPSLFWLILGVFNFVCAAMPPYRGFSLINLVLALMCFYWFIEARRRETGEEDE